MISTDVIRRTLVVLAALLLRSTLSAQVQPLIQEGDSLESLGTVSLILDIAVNDSGDWLAEVRTKNAGSSVNMALVRNGEVVLVEEQPFHAPRGATLDLIERISFNNEAEGCWTLTLENTAGSFDDAGIFLGSRLLLQKGMVSSATGFSPGTSYLSLYDAKINDRAEILVMADVNDSMIPTDIDSALVLLKLDKLGNLASETVVVKEGDLLPGQVDVIQDAWSTQRGVAFNDIGDVLFITELNGPSTVDRAVYFNSTLLAQEGSASPLPGRSWFNLASGVVTLNDNRDYVIAGWTDGGPEDNYVIAKNGEKLVQEGETLEGIAPAALTTFGGGPLFIANSGDVLWYGDFAPADLDTDSALFINRTLLVREGLTMVDGVAIDTLRGQRAGYHMSPSGRYVIFEAVLNDGTDGAYLIDRGKLAHQEVRNGSGVNELCLRAPDPPVLASAWTTEVSTGHVPGATFTGIFAFEDSLAGLDLEIGELLLDPRSKHLFTLIAPADSGTASFQVDVPNSLSLVGRVLHTQGFIMDGSALHLCNALYPSAGF